MDKIGSLIGWFGDVIGVSVMSPMHASSLKAKLVMYYSFIWDPSELHPVSMSPIMEPYNKTRHHPVRIHGE